jgi:hypothetical protein
MNPSDHFLPADLEIAALTPAERARILSVLRMMKDRSPCD